MREIKFRAWDKADNWLGEVTSIDFDEETVFIETRTVDDENYFKFDDIEIMQYTGLKDKNGKEIFEGDIIQLKHETGYQEWDESKEVVEFSMGAFSCGIYSAPNGECDCEIIGNIYENPELLEEPK